MMRFRPYTLLASIFLLTLFSGRIHSQDIHFTLHNMTPLAFNPANTGGFYGSYRISGLYRDQYRSVAGTGAFMTPTLSVDLPVIKGFREHDWVGVGVFFYTDRSGDAGLTQTSTKLSAAYHLALNKKGNTSLAIAYQFGGIGRYIKDTGKLRFEGELPGVGGPAEPSMFLGSKEDAKGFGDHVGGLKLTSKYNKTDEFTIGFAMGKFGRPDWSVLESSGNYRVDPRMHFQVGLSRLLSDKIRFSPNISYQRILKGSQATLVAQGLVDYNYNEAKNITLIGGIGWRSGQGIGDAAQVMMGAYIKDIKVMIGYDVNISSLSIATGTVGGFELSAQYIGKVYKRPKPDPVIFCPRF